MRYTAKDWFEYALAIVVCNLTWLSCGGIVARFVTDNSSKALITLVTMIFTLMYNSYVAVRPDKKYRGLSSELVEKMKAVNIVIGVAVMLLTSLLFVYIVFRQ